MKKEKKIEVGAYYLSMRGKILEKLFHLRELRRLRLENEHLIEYNKKLSNQLRLKEIERKNWKRKWGRGE